MEQAPVWLGTMLGLSSLGFYIFLAVWIAAVIWSRTKQKMAVQETLRTLIESGATVTPEAIDALRRTKPRRSPTEIKAHVKQYLYWGLFLVSLGILATLYGLRFSDRPFLGIVFFLIPGLFCLAHSLITSRTQLPSKE
jgi:hypothetical protein